MYYFSILTYHFLLYLNWTCSSITAPKASPKPSKSSLQKEAFVSEGNLQERQNERKAKPSLGINVNNIRSWNSRLSRLRYIKQYVKSFYNLSTILDRCEEEGCQQRRTINLAAMGVGRIEVKGSRFREGLIQNVVKFNCDFSVIFLDFFFFLHAPQLRMNYFSKF